MGTIKINKNNYETNKDKAKGRLILKKQLNSIKIR